MYKASFSNFITLKAFPRLLNALAISGILLFLVGPVSPNAFAIPQAPKHTFQDHLKTDSLGELQGQQTNFSAPKPSTVDIHQALSVIRNAQAPKDDGWLEQFPLLKKLVLDVRYFINQFFENLFKAFSKALPDIKPFVGLSGAASKTISIIVSALFAFIGLIALFFILRWWLAYLENKRPQKPRTLNKHFDDSLLINTEHHWQEADTFARQGHFSEAIRQVYLATLCLFDESKLLPFDESWTNIEYQQALSYRKNVPQDSKPLFSSLALHFEYARYGHYQPNEADYQDAAEKYQHLTNITQLFQEQNQATKKNKGGKR